jgi:asparagine synthase (glutamine-hydrolysing)
MCGITGIISNNRELITKEKIQLATSCLQHRGPDDEGTWIDNDHTIALGNRRLAIIDLAEEAAQPMHYLGRYVMVFNGELYNYIELKSALEQKGHTFLTQSDTEVILASYHAYGSECLERFDGMFAFAIWDRKDKVLFAARDRFGEKPFFYYYDEELLAFASEMKSLWKMGVKKEVNSGMLYNFLTIGYATNPGNTSETFYSNIQKLPPASYIQYNAHTRKLSVNKYWQIFSEPNHRISEKEAIEKFTGLFRQSVRRRLRSDVCIGTSLSGGLDSSSIVSFCAGERTEHYTHKCFTASFPDFNKDETQYASLVANRYKLEQYKVTIDESEVVALMEKVMQYQEEPISTSSPLAQYKVFAEAYKQNVKVLLDGQGADEVLGGYHKYYKWYWLELYRNRKLNSTGELAYAQVNGIKEPFGFKHKIAALFPDLTTALVQTKKEKKAKRLKGLNEDFAYINRKNLYYSTPLNHNLNGALYFDTFIHGLEELLRIADRNSMANSTEVRLPFLNHELVQFLFTLPPHHKIYWGWTKWLLRKSVEHSLPDEIVWRKNKTGYEPPQKKWMEYYEVQQAIREAKNMLVAKGILDRSEVHKTVQPHDAHVADSWDWKCWSASFLFRQD